MATQILRTVDRWRFEVPLALALAAATGFAALAMPRALFERLPVAGRTGTAGHVGLAVLLAIVCGVAGYRAMRRPAKAVAADEDIDPSDDIDAPSGLSEDRLLRLRRADRHPDAPPRAPIRASRDLGEPFMDVGGFAPPSGEPEVAPAEAESAGPAIIDGDYVELEDAIEPPVDAAAAPELAVEEPAIEPVAEMPAVALHGLGDPFVEDASVERPAAEESPVEQPAVAVAPVAEAPLAEPIVAPVAPPAAATAIRQDISIAAMTERLSAGMERRAGRQTAPARDMRPALRDALDELNRLAARRG